MQESNHEVTNDCIFASFCLLVLSVGHFGNFLFTALSSAGQIMLPADDNVVKSEKEKQNQF